MWNQPGIESEVIRKAESQPPDHHQRSPQVSFLETKLERMQTGFTAQQATYALTLLAVFGCLFFSRAMWLVGS